MKMVSLVMLSAVIHAAEKGKHFITAIDMDSFYGQIDRHFMVIALSLGAVLAAEWIVVGIITALE